MSYLATHATILVNNELTIPLQYLYPTHFIVSCDKVYLHLFGFLSILLVL